MALISFPISPENVRSKSFAEASLITDFPPGYTRQKRDLFYIVPANRTAILTATFNVLFQDGNSVEISKSFSFTEYLKPGDTVLMGTWLYTSVNSYYYEVYYNLNSVNIFTSTISPVSTSSAPIATGSCSRFVLELDK